MFEQTLAAAPRSPYAKRALPAAMAFHLAVGAWVVAVTTLRIDEIPLPQEPMVFAQFVPVLPAEEREVRIEPRRPATQAETERPAQPLATPPAATPQSLVDAEIPPAATIAEPATTLDAPATAADGTTGDPRSTVTDASAGREGDDDFVRLVVRASRPEVLSRVEPRYTEPARRAHIQGVVELDLAVDATGRVVRVEVVRALPFGLTEEAERAVKQWRFRPAAIDGRPVGVLFSVLVNFNLR
jgi:protein TonB